MRVWKDLEPKNVFSYFEDICGIPHGSGNTQRISDYCVEFAKAHHLRYRQEPCGNVIIWKDASPGYEDADAVMLQGHMDMVAVRTEDCDLDMEREGLRIAITEDGEWVYAKGTSLGGDDGIAVAYALAILDDDTIPHPPLEAVFTVDEEVGLLGAAALDAGDLRSRILLNMDSEEDGVFLTSCAGGATFTCRLPAVREKRRGIVYEWKAEGLQGGHSGAEIHLGRANANLIFGRYLAQVKEKADFSISTFYGGGKDNAIPAKCRALLVAAPEDADRLEQETAAFASVIKKEYRTVEPEFSLTLKRQPETSASVLARETETRLTILLEHLPSGIQRMMPDIPDMVQTSLNMGILRCEEKEIDISFSVRSSSGTEKEWLLKQMRDLSELAGAEYEITGVYSAWEYNPASRIKDIMSDVFEEMTGEKPALTGIHAGVECGFFCEKLPGIDCISFGPRMRDIHTTREKLNIASVKRTYELTVKALERLK